MNNFKYLMLLSVVLCTLPLSAAHLSEAQREEFGRKIDDITAQGALRAELNKVIRDSKNNHMVIFEKLGDVKSRGFRIAENKELSLEALDDRIEEALDDGDARAVLGLRRVKEFIEKGDAVLKDILEEVDDAKS